jgi:hypothetical protein
MFTVTIFGLCFNQTAVDDLYAAFDRVVTEIGRPAYAFGAEVALLEAVLDWLVFRGLGLFLRLVGPLGVRQFDGEPLAGVVCLVAQLSGQASLLLEIQPRGQVRRLVGRVVQRRARRLALALTARGNRAEV